MEFSFTEEQNQLRETVGRFLTANSPPSAVRSLMDTEDGYDRAVWCRAHEELGIGGVHIPEIYGGAGLSFIETAIVLEEMGRALFCSPYFSSNVMAATATLEIGTDEHKEQLLAAINATRMIATVAIYESSRTAELANVKTRCRNGRLSGIKRFVTDAGPAGCFIVSARDERDAINLYLVAKDPATTEVTPSDELDTTRKLATVTFTNAAASRLSEQTMEPEQFESLLATFAIALANEMVGGAQRLLDSAVEYAKTRVQFGREIGSLQAIKHKCAELLLDVELAKSAAYRAAWSIVERDDVVAHAAIAKVCANETYMRAAAECIQIHGGIGFTWENDTHLWFKRAKSSEVFLGETAYHQEELMKAWAV